MRIPPGCRERCVRAHVPGASTDGELKGPALGVKVQYQRRDAYALELLLAMMPCHGSWLP
jgi:hypothetical protein